MRAARIVCQTAWLYSICKLCCNTPSHEQAVQHCSLDLELDVLASLLCCEEVPLLERGHATASAPYADTNEGDQAFHKGSTWLLHISAASHIRGTCIFAKPPFASGPDEGPHAIGKNTSSRSRICRSSCLLSVASVSFLPGSTSWKG